MIKRSVLSAAILVATLATSAYAADDGFTAGLMIGQSKFDVGAVPAGVTVDDKDTAFRLHGGYQFNANLGAEIGYSDLGEAALSAPGASGAIGAKGWDLSLVGTLPLSDAFSLYARVGAFRWKAEGNVNISGGGTGNASDTGTDTVFGIGARYHFTKNVSAGLEYDRYKVDDGDVDVWGVTLGLKF
jgi:OOP family OmpA-OmpF porin